MLVFLDPPNEMYGKILSIPDELIYTYFELVTDVTSKELNEIKAIIKEKKENPRNLKRKLARTIIEMYYSKDVAIEAEKEFDKIFVKKGIPDNIPETKFEQDELQIVDLITNVKFAPTRSEARRLIKQGGVSIDNEKITDINFVVKFDKDKILKVGKRKFIKILGK